MNIQAAENSTMQWLVYKVKYFNAIVSIVFKEQGG